MFVSFVFVIALAIALAIVFAIVFVPGEERTTIARNSTDEPEEKNRP
jgi:hypothetical protein